jgi:hypothetical protein
MNQTAISCSANAGREEANHEGTGIETTGFL